MALKLKSIRLKNWKCYQNEEIEFNLDTQQHIWIVFGQNGFGKTSILEAIQWCLYGGDELKSSALLDSFNRIVLKKDPNLELCVQLKFDRNGDIYDISRTAKRVVRGITASAQTSEAIVQKNGIHQADSRERIEELLPRAL
ncbi:MAG: AAA family ATPase [Oscillatoriales cyanobacterium RU_3_3]|nr:AAA family ATPase [Oscillatoriales cyanobacterium RU_3_3]